MTAVLEIDRLGIEYRTARGWYPAVQDFSLQLTPGRVLGLVGESGCGKSSVALALMGLLPGNGRLTADRLRVAGHDLPGLDEARLRRLRGPLMSMVFQEPSTALNPVYRVGDQLVEVLRRHRRLRRPQAFEAAVGMLARVGIGDPYQRMRQYPHQLSGGLRQRVMIAMALVLGPRLLIADEPTTALDVTTQAQILMELRRLSADLGTAVLLITHDLGVVAQLCDEVAVMYAGRLVEQASCHALFARPRHRYTAGLLQTMPRIRPVRPERLPVIPGAVPGLEDRPAGCGFAPRCAHAGPECTRGPVPLVRVGASRVACLHPVGEHG